MAEQVNSTEESWRRLSGPSMVNVLGGAKNGDSIVSTFLQLKASLIFEGYILTSFYIKVHLA